MTPLEDLPRHWHGGRPGPTAFYNSISVLLPAFERFVIRVAREHRERVPDPALRDQIRELCRQEGDHSREHARLNAHIARLGYPAAPIEAGADRWLRRLDRRLSPRTRLAAATAFEHLTAVMSHSLLSWPEWWFADADPAVAALWRWHAEEESEHRSVLFDTYRAVGGSYPERLCVGTIAVTVLLSAIFAVAALLLWSDGPRAALRAAPGLAGFALPGMLPFVPVTLAYTLPGFHPRQIGATR